MYYNLPVTFIKIKVLFKKWHGFIILNYKDNFPTFHNIMR